MTISTRRLRLLRGNAAAVAAFTGLQGELVFNTDTYTLHLQDGATAGGYSLATTADLANISANGNYGNSNVASYLASNSNVTILTTSNITSYSDIIGNVFSGQYLVLGNAINQGQSPFLIANVNNAINLLTGNRGNGNVSIQLRANNNLTGIYLRNDNGSMGFNTVPSGPNIGYTFTFNGSAYANEFYTEANMPTGYQFNTTDGDTGLSHVNLGGNLSAIRIRQAGRETVKFYSNDTTEMRGNIVISDGVNYGQYPNAYMQVYGYANSYQQVVNQNLSNSAASSSDFVATADNGSDTSYFIDMGINSSQFASDSWFPESSTINDGYLYVVGYDAAGPSTGNIGNLYIGSTNGVVKTFIGNTSDANVVTTVSTNLFAVSGNITATGTLRTNATTISLGYHAGNSGQGALTVAVGNQAGEIDQGLQATAVGAGAGNYAQGIGTTAVGTNAGAVNQGLRAVAIGALAGSQNQGQYAVAIGNFAGGTNQANNSIILSATGTNWTASTSGFFVAPVATSTTGNVLYYNTTTNEITYGAAGSTNSLSNGTSNVSILTANGNVTVTAAGTKTWTLGTDGTLTLPSGGQIGEIQYAGGIDLFASNAMAYTQINYNNTNFIYADSGVSALQTPNAYVTADTLTKRALIQVIDPDTSADSTWNFAANGELALPADRGKIGLNSYVNGMDLYNNSGGSGYVKMNFGDQSYMWVDPAGAHIQTSGGNWDFNANGVLVATGNIVASFATSPAPVISGYAFDGVSVNANIGTFNTIYGTIGTASQTNITTVGTLTGLAVSGTTNTTTLQVGGNATIGNLIVTGNSTIIGNITQISGNSGQFFGNAATGFNALYTGIAAGYTPLQQTIIQSSGNYNDYVQINLQNINSGNAATGDYIVTADNGSDATYFIDMGIASSNFDGLSANIVGNSVRANDGYLYTMGNGSGNQGGNLIFGTGTVGKVVKIIAGGGNTSNVVATVSAGAFTVNGNITGSYILGNGSQLTGVAAATATTAQYVTGLTSANVITALGYTPSNYGDANVAAFSGNLNPGNIILANASGRIQFKASGTTNGSYIYDTLGSLYLSPNTSYSATAGVIIAGSGFILGPNSARNLTLNYNNVNGAVGLQANVVIGTTQAGGNLTVANSITASGNVTGNYFIGNGALLTGITASANYGNTNVAAFLGAYGSNTIVTTGNITGGYFIGNGALLTGIAASSNYGNTNVAAYLPTYTGNVNAAYYFGNGSQLTGITATTATTAQYVTGLTSANVTTALGYTPTNYSDSNVGSYLSSGTTGAISALSATFRNGEPNPNYNTSQITFGYAGTSQYPHFIHTLHNAGSGSYNAINFYTSDGTQSGVFPTNGILGLTISNGKIGVGNNTNPSYTLDVAGNAYVSGNISALYFVGNGSLLTGIVATSSYNDSNVAAFLANIGSNTITTTGNITGNYFIGNGALLTGISASANYGNTNVAAFLGAYGSNTIVTTGNITAGNLIGNASGTTASYTGNVTGNFFIGNGSTLTGVTNYSNANAVSMLSTNTNVIIGNTNVYPLQGNITQVFVGNATALTSGGNTGPTLTNILNNAYYDAAGALRYRNTQTGALSIALGGSGGISVGGTTGSVTANAASGMGAWLTLNGTTLQTYNSIGITSSGTITTTSGSLVTGAAVSTLFNTVASTVNMGGAATTIAMGASTATVTIGSGTGNLTVGNISAGGNITVGNVIGLTTNTTITAGTYTTTFDNVGNVTVSGNLTINGVYAGYAPARAAVRLYGNSSTNLTAGTTISNQVIDYNQGSYYNNSTGLFTVPIAGLYHCYATIRVGNNNALNQAALLKNNNTTGANVIAFWETDTNAGVASHFSITGYAKCVAGDTISLKVITGNVQFDSNDSWGVTYIG